MFSKVGSDANIDWASLAQQWIQRNTAKTTDENDLQIQTPPPPNISGNYYEKRARNYVGYEETGEKGEADMEMDEDESAPPPPSMIVPTNPANANLMHYPLHAGVDQHSDSSSAWNTWISPTIPVIPPQYPKTNPTAHIPSLMKINVSNPNDSKSVESSYENTTATIDAAKRKALPAWIREGLEKMEREKQRQLEREQLIERKSEKKFSALLSPTQNSDLTVKDHVIKSLEIDDSSGNEQDEDDDDNLPYKVKSTKNSKHIGNVKATAAVPILAVSNGEDDDASALHVSKTYEQRLADLMIAVRRTLTELLLEVTNDEISKIARETIQSSKLKASSAQVIRKSALSSITNRLGLAAYSSSGDESDSDNSDGNISKDGNRRRGGGTSTAAEDSEEEIRTKLRARRRAFAKTSEEIEERIALNAAREEQKLYYYKQQEKKQQQYSKESDNEDQNVKNVGATATSSKYGVGIGKQNNNARDFGETTTESKLQQSNGKKSKERNSRRGERTTRFSDNKDSKNVMSYMAQINNPTGATNTNTVAPLATSTSVHGFQTATDVKTNLPSLYTPSATAGINSMLSAAEAAIEKATKIINSSTSSSSRRHNAKSRISDKRERERRRHKREQRHRHSSNESNSSSSSSSSSSSNKSNESPSSSSDTSRHSKYSRASSKKRSTHKSSYKNDNSSRKYYDRHYREDQRRRRHHDYEEHSKIHRHTSYSKSSRSNDRSRSRSRSTYSSSSRKRQHSRH